MIDREERYNELCSRGFYFENGQIFDTFLETIEKLSKQYDTPEINYYRAFEQKLKNIEDKKGIPAVGAVKIIVYYNEERIKGSKQYKISKIDISQHTEFKEHKNSRFS